MIKKILLLFSFYFFLNCNVPYDGEERYLFETTVVDSNNNPIANKEVSVLFYNGDYFDNNGNYLFGEREFDEIIYGNTDANGTIKLAFPFASDRENIVIKIGNNSDGYLNSDFELINIRKNNFSNYKLIESPIKLYSFDETTFLTINVQNTTSNKYVSKIEFIGNINIIIKNFNSKQDDYDYFPLTNKTYTVIKNQNAILKYEVTTIINGQQTKTNVEEQIIILENNIDYTITL